MFSIITIIGLFGIAVLSIVTTTKEDTTEVIDETIFEIDN
jgi:hypothetical protein